MRSAALAALFAALTAQGLMIPAEQKVINNQMQVPKGFNVDLSDRRLIQFESGAPVWMSELEKIQAMAAGRKFFDITDAQDLADGVSSSRLLVKEFPAPNATEKVKGIIKTLSSDGPKANLQKFTSFTTRYYKSASGRESQLWLLSKIQEITDQFAPASLKSLISINEFSHSWGQNSILVKIAGSAPSEGAVIISAHQDSINQWPWLGAPGADDDGSGTVTILESYRGLIAGGFTPTEDVWFHWYSAEEGGLLGSQAVAKEWKSKHVPVKAQVQFDMTAWVKKGTREEVGVITDYVDPGVTNFNKKLIDAYLDIPYVETRCGYACSDHASWGKAGYPSSFSIESTFDNSNHYIHSSNDRIDISPEFSFSHMLEFSKLAVAFAIELGGWK